MTPAIKLLNKLRIPHTVHPYEHDPNYGSFGMEAADKLGLSPELVFKTLIIELDNSTLACAILPVDQSLNLKKAAKALGAKKAAMADIVKAERATGYIKGGVSPFAQKKRLATVVDASALTLESMLVSGGKRGLDIELAPQDLINTCQAIATDILVKP